MKKSFILVILLPLISACADEPVKRPEPLPFTGPFDHAFILRDEVSTPKLRGQLLYMPVYSNVPYHIVGMEAFDMSAFVAVHNTDLTFPITITTALFFNKMGEPVFDFLTEGNILLGPLATTDFYVPYEDKSGNGANFLIEWISDTLVCEPLVESVTISLKPNQSVAVLSRGRVIREMR